MGTVGKMPYFHSLDRSSVLKPVKFPPFKAAKSEWRENIRTQFFPIEKKKTIVGIQIRTLGNSNVKGPKSLIVHLPFNNHQGSYQYSILIPDTPNPVDFSYYFSKQFRTSDQFEHLDEVQIFYLDRMCDIVPYQISFIYI